MAARYKVLSPFLGSNNKVLDFNDEIEEKDVIVGHLEKRLKDGHLALIPEEVKKESTLKSMFSKNKSK